MPFGQFVGLIHSHLEAPSIHLTEKHRVTTCSSFPVSFTLFRPLGSFMPFCVFLPVSSFSSDLLVLSWYFFMMYVSILR